MRTSSRLFCTVGGLHYICFKLAVHLIDRFEQPPILCLYCKATAEVQVLVLALFRTCQSFAAFSASSTGLSHQLALLQSFAANAGTAEALRPVAQMRAHQSMFCVINFCVIDLCDHFLGDQKHIESCTFMTYRQMYASVNLLQTRCMNGCCLYL